EYSEGSLAKSDAMLARCFHARRRNRPNLRGFIDFLPAVVELIAATTTKAGLKIESALDTRAYEKRIKVSDAQMKALDIQGDRSILNGTTPSAREQLPIV